MTAGAPVRVSADWLDQREAADAAGRSGDLSDLVGRRLPRARPVVIADLGSGTGSMTRWLAPRLPGAQDWHLYDVDEALLEVAAARSHAVKTADGVAVTVQTHHLDITELRPRDLATADLITASALLDVLTGQEVQALAQLCIEAGCPALLTLTVVGRVELTPADPLDAVITAAFNAHQRRPARDSVLQGPDAVWAVADRFRESGSEVHVRASPWRLGPPDARLASAWFDGWVAAAREVRGDLAPAIDAYADRRREELAAGRLQAVVHHADLLALPATAAQA